MRLLILGITSVSGRIFDVEANTNFNYIFQSASNLKTISGNVFTCVGDCSFQYALATYNLIEEISGNVFNCTGNSDFSNLAYSSIPMKLTRKYF